MRGRDGQIIMGIITLDRCMVLLMRCLQEVLGFTGLLVVRVVGVVVMLGRMCSLISVGVGQARLCFTKI